MTELLIPELRHDAEFINRLNETAQVMALVKGL